MSDELKKVYAQRAYKTLCEALDARDWNYKKDEKKLLVKFGVKGDDMPMEFAVVVDEVRQLLRLMSFIPIKFPEEKRLEGAVATCIASHSMVDGGFDYDLSDGTIVYRQAVCFRECLLSVDAVQYLISCACAMVDKYNDRFFMVAKGMMSLTDFLKAK